jgi:hypothetical protein
MNCKICDESIKQYKGGNLFRIDVGDAFWLMLKAPSRKRARQWAAKEIPGPAESISIRAASADDAIDYAIGGFHTYDTTEHLIETEP